LRSRAYTTKCLENGVLSKFDSSGQDISGQFTEREIFQALDRITPEDLPRLLNE
jgi:hypothetical protein